MAEKKLSVRQQMINMMYLVLMALLALQVSNAVLEKFIFIDDSLRHAVEIAREKNDDKIHAIEQQVEDNGNKEFDVDILDKAHRAHELTQEMMNYIKIFREEIISIAGGLDEHRRPKDLADYDKQMALTLGSGPVDNKGKGYDLGRKLNDYVKNINLLHDSLNIPLLALDAKDIPEFKNDDRQRGKDFAQLNFDHTPNAACLAILSQFKSEVARVESQALSILGSEVGATDFRFDNIIAVIKPESKIVAAGTKYKAEMFLSASSSTVKPRMFFYESENNKRPLDIANGVGNIEFTVQGGKYDKDGKALKKWKGEIIFNGYFGDTIFSVEEEYIVARPVVQVQSASVSALYLNCGNELNIQVPALGPAYDPSFSARGAQVIKSSRKGFITVVPSAANVSINVFSGGNKLSTEKFRVKRVPNPTIKFNSRGRGIDMKNGVPASSLRSIEVRAVPDKSFSEFLPKDARYRVFEWEITLARGKRAIGAPKLVHRLQKANIAKIIQRARAGDRIIIEVKTVKRRNFQGKEENVRGLGTVIAVIPLH